MNVLTAEDERLNDSVHTEDLIHIKDENGTHTFELPSSFSGADWSPRSLHPIEVIDGQHRLWAFGPNSGIPDTFQLPVVAFEGLDISWQAYLFWTINIKPKRINPSLAFDLYPLLRTEDWLDNVSLAIYRETRAQELTEALWSHPESPWFRRINMLGEKAHPGVTQSAWVRSLLATCFRSYEGRGIRIGGLFGGRMGQDEPVLPWSRAQQAAFVLFGWKLLAEEISAHEGPWAESLRRTESADGDPAFSGPTTLLNTDQGVRGYLYALNDLTYVLAEDLQLDNWPATPTASAVDETAVNQALDDLRDQPVAQFIKDLTQVMAQFDWRTSAAPELDDDMRASKAAFRGSGGYRELRRQLTLHARREGRGRVRESARDVAERLEWSDEP